MRRASAHLARGSCHDTAKPFRRDCGDLPAEWHGQPNPAGGLAPLSRLASVAFAADEGGCLLRRLPDCLDRDAAAFCRAGRDIRAPGPKPARGDGGLVRDGAFAGAARLGLRRTSRNCAFPANPKPGYASSAAPGYPGCARMRAMAWNGLRLWLIWSSGARLASQVLPLRWSSCRFPSNWRSRYVLAPFW